MSYKSVLECINKGEKGFVLRNSVFLPFHCEMLSIWIGKEMSFLASPDLIVDFSDPETIGIREGDTYTNLVFRKWKDLYKEIGHHKGHIIIHAAEKGMDIFKIDNLHYIRIGFLDNKREVAFELIDDPFLL
jgi:hypothetical protein